MYNCIGFIALPTNIIIKKTYNNTKPVFRRKNSIKKKIKKYIMYSYICNNTNKYKRCRKITKQSLDNIIHYMGVCVCVCFFCLMKNVCCTSVCLQMNIGIKKKKGQRKKRIREIQTCYGNGGRFKGKIKPCRCVAKYYNLFSTTIRN